MAQQSQQNEQLTTLELAERNPMIPREESSSALILGSLPIEIRAFILSKCASTTLRKSIALINRQLNALSKTELAIRQVVLSEIKRESERYGLVVDLRYLTQTERSDAVDFYYHKKWSIDRAIEKFTRIEHAKLQGLKLGLTLAHVNTANFSEAHVTYVKNHGVASFANIAELYCYQIEGMETGLNIDQVQDAGFQKRAVENLNPTQVRGLAIGLTRDQVQTPNFSDIHVDFVKYCGVQAFESISGLNGTQVNGLAIGLTRDQVQTPNFSDIHVLYVGRRSVKFFARISGLTSIQVCGVAVGLTREQVQTPNFSDSHVDYVKAHGVESFDTIAGLTCGQVAGVSAGLTRQGQSSHKPSR